MNVQNNRMTGEHNMNFRKNSGINFIFSIIVIILTGLIVSYDYAYAKNIDDFLTLALYEFARSQKDENRTSK